MKRIWIVAYVAGLTVGLASSQARPQSPLDTAFTYQGQLKEGAIPANGIYDFQFDLYDAATDGRRIGSVIFDGELMQPHHYPPIHVANGLFTVQLDFGADAFSGDARWLEIQVRLHPDSGDPRYTVLSPRQPMTPTPYAAYALSGPGSGEGYWAAAGDDIYNTNSGKVGIGTTEPVASLQVINGGESHAIWAETTDIGLYAHRTGTGGTWPAVHGECDSLTDGSSGVRGVITSSDPGWLSAGVYGINHGLTFSDGVGVRGEHYGAGSGVYGHAPIGSGVSGYSESGNGVSGVSDSGTGVWGTCTSGVGVRGVSAETDGVVGINNGGDYKSGVYGETSATLGHGVFGRNNAPFTLTEGQLGGPDHGVYGYAYDTLGGEWWTKGYLGGSAHAVYGESSGSATAGSFRIYNSSSGATALHCSTTGTGLAFHAEGRAKVHILEITGGADLSEQFQVTESEQQSEPGMTVCIDPQNPGELAVCNKPYDRTVAGVISGAGGIKPGMLMGQVDSIADGEYPVALTGRVWCWCDATSSPIKPGDLLTTSSVAGHAMKVVDYAKAQGAVIGKAMTPLADGKGLALVLVSLQ